MNALEIENLTKIYCDICNLMVSFDSILYKREIG